MICAHSLSVGTGTTLATMTGATKVNKVLAAFVPCGVVTRTLAVPGLPAGVTQVMVVALTTVTGSQAAPPMVTPVASVKLLPVILIAVPPPRGTSGRVDRGHDWRKRRTAIGRCSSAEQDKDAVGRDGINNYIDAV